MNFLTLCQETWDACGLSGQGPQDVNKEVSMHGRVVGWVKEAYLHIQQMHTNWSFLYRARQVTLPHNARPVALKQLDLEDFNILLRLALVDSPGKLTPLVYRNTFDPFTFGVTTGKPTNFAIGPTGEWYFDPSPDADYTLAVEYFRQPHALVDNFDEPIIPSQFQHAIIHKAKQSYGLFDEDAAAVQEAVTEFKATLVRMEARCLPPLRWGTNPFFQEDETWPREAAPL